MRFASWRTWAAPAIGIVAFTLVFAASSVPGVARTETWVAKPLACPDSWVHVFPNSIDRKGRIVGFYEVFAPAYRARAIQWKSPASDAAELPMPTGAQNSSAVATNDRGQVCGNVDYRAALWERDGTVTDLHARLTGFDYSSAFSVNRRGDVAGYGVTTGNGTTRAILWPRRGAAVVLPFDGSLYLHTNVWAMNDRGTVCGNALLLPSGRPNHAVYWPRGGDLIDLHEKVRAAMPTAEGSACLRVLSDGRIVGNAWEPFTGTTSTVLYAWIYDPRAGSVRVLDAGGSDLVEAWGSAGSSTLVGFLDGDPDINRPGLGASRPALWRKRKSPGGTAWELTVLPVPAGYVGLALYNANARGVLVAAANVADGTVDAVVVTRSRK